MNHHVHCSVCDYAALFQVRRFKKIGWEFVCEVHFEWLNDNCRRPFEVRRVVDPCECSRAAGLTIEDLDQIVTEGTEPKFENAASKLLAVCVNVL